MVNTLQAAAFYSAFYGLGMIGFVAITALPVRLWQLLRRHFWALRSGLAQRIAFLIFAAVGFASVTLAGTSLFHVARCLLGFHCSANRAGGWIALAGVGFWYLAFEVAAFAIGRVALKPPRSQPNNSFKPKPLRGSA